VCVPFLDLFWAVFYVPRPVVTEVAPFEVFEERVVNCCLVKHSPFSDKVGNEFYYGSFDGFKLQCGDVWRVFSVSVLDPLPDLS